jgi:glycine hydroxymethyltransferase
VNVQSLSGSPANFEVYTAVLKPHERMMALDLPHGGHLSHGYQTATKKISAVSIYFECLPYRLDEHTGLIDYETLKKNAILYRPKLLVCGASAYSRHIDYEKMHHIANINHSYLMTDMAHISGLVAAGVMPSPFDHSDIVTTTTHKSLRGPRGAMIFYRKGVRSTDKHGKITAYELEDAINGSVFPGHQGGPHNHTITALAVALKQAQTPAYRQYQEAVLVNCQALCKRFQANGYTIVSGGTDNHLFMVDMRNKGLNGAKVEKVLELCNIAINKNTVPGDKSALTPGGIRMGTPALTTRGFDEKDFEKVADLLHVGINIALEVNQKAGVTSTLKAFNAALADATQSTKDIASLKSEVVNFVRKFPVVGFSQNDMKYQTAGI